MHIAYTPLYYAVVGVALRAAGVSRFSTAHRMARLLSAALFSTTGIMLTVFIMGRWRASALASTSW